ncbi:hypothetical protein [Paraclostridium sordellii]|uniref:hypothetical protein n=1 Tax=Paraclostridium sordellii TaxID=1505 RepID=UPI0011C0FD1D|nr:hypothetical protein [Paeniclostridium sordellii]
MICGELDLDKLDKSELEHLFTLFNEVINKKLITEQDLDIIYLAQSRVERVLSKNHSNFISKVKTLFKGSTIQN